MPPSPASTRNLQPILIAGPTAVGKSEVALRLAESIGGEIIAVDSMQVYRGLDIGTAKPTPTDRARVPHHLIDVAEVTEPFDAAQFVRLACQALTQIQARGGIPIFCGGTGLYFKAFLEGLGDAPPADAALRAALEATPMTELLRELKQHDAKTFESIDRGNPRRIVRAVEVIRLTGKPFSAQRAQWLDTTGTAPAQDRHYGLTRTAADLRARIDARVEDHFRKGLLAEVAGLLARGLAQNKAALQAIGYRQVVEHLRGERSLAQTIELVKVRTRQFAKRQLTWFRRQARLTWVQVEPQDTVEAVVERLLRECDRG